MSLVPNPIAHAPARGLVMFAGWGPGQGHETAAQNRCPTEMYNRLSP